MRAPNCATGPSNNIHRNGTSQNGQCGSVAWAGLVCDSYRITLEILGSDIHTAFGGTIDLFASLPQNRSVLKSSIGISVLPRANYFLKSIRARRIAA